jgi:hypothetical protein
MPSLAACETIAKRSAYSRLLSSQRAVSETSWQTMSAPSVSGSTLALMTRVVEPQRTRTRDSVWGARSASVALTA